MTLNLGKIHKQILYFLILLLIIYPGYGQDKLKFGKTSLSPKELNVDKYKCVITPSASINEDAPDNLKLFFNVSWFDKNNASISPPDKFSLITKHLKNIEEYCDENGKKLSSKPGLFSKEIELTNSFTIVPAGILEMANYRNVIFKDNNPPVNMKVLNQSSEPITFNLVLYIGKEKNNALDIDDKLEKISWSFILPKKQNAQPEVLSCAELEKKYNTQFKENQPKFNIGYYESKSLEIESGALAKDVLFELKSSLLEFKADITSLSFLKETIRNNPSYKDCVDLPVIVGSINNYLTDPARIDAIIEKINKAIVNSADGEGGGSGEPPNEAFLANVQHSISAYNLLYDLKMNPDLLSNYDEGYLDELYIQLKKKKTAQDSLYNVLISIDESPENKRKYKEFIEYNNGAIAIIEELSPDILNNKEPEAEGDNDTLPDKGSFPYVWIIFPVIVLLTAFGVYKYVGKLKKAKNISKKA
ncbi:MAG: hypothetical protein R2750_06145 [Bacteroidales bacterium]